MSHKGLKGNLILSTFYQVLTLIIPLITAPYVARVLGVDGTGIYSYTYSYAMYFTLFGALGTVSYGTREIARQRDSLEGRSQLFWEIEVLKVLTSSISICAWGLWIFFNTTYQIYYLILSILLLGTMFDISWFYAGMEEFQYTVTQNSIFKILGAVSIFMFVKSEDDLWKYILILALSVFLANISMWLYLPKFIHRVPVKSLKLQKHFHETFIYFIPTIATSIYTILDKTLIGLITQTPSENGNYEQATKMINMAKVVCFTGINSVLQSRISYLFAEQKIEEIKQRIAMSMDYILLIGIGICFGTIGIAERFVPFFFGPGYDKTVILLQLMAPLVVIIGVSNCLGSQYFTPSGQRKRSAKVIVLGAFINLILNLCFIPGFRSYGAAAASVMAELTISVLYVKMSDDFMTWRQLASFSWKRLIAGILMCSSVICVGKWVSIAIILLIILQVLCGVIVYVVVLCALQDNLLQELLNVINMKVKKKIGR